MGRLRQRDLAALTVLPSKRDNVERHNVRKRGKDGRRPVPRRRELQELRFTSGQSPAPASLPSSRRENKRDVGGQGSSAGTLRQRLRHLVGGLLQKDGGADGDVALVEELLAFLGIGALEAHDERNADVDAFGRLNDTLRDAVAA